MIHFVCGVIALLPFMLSAGSEPRPISPELERLELFVGSWRVAETHFDPRGETLAAVQGTEEIKWILDQRAIERIYTTSSESRVFRALGVVSYSEADQRYKGSWFDNASTTGPSQTSGEWEEPTRTMVWTLESRTKDGSTQRYKVVEKFVDAETRTATTYQLSDKGVVMLMEVRYSRVSPCPSGIRRLFDNE